MTKPPVCLISKDAPVVVRSGNPFFSMCFMDMELWKYTDSKGGKGTINIALPRNREEFDLCFRWGTKVQSREDLLIELLDFEGRVQAVYKIPKIKMICQRLSEAEYCRKSYSFDFEFDDIICL